MRILGLDICRRDFWFSYKNSSPFFGGLRQGDISSCSLQLNMAILLLLAKGLWIEMTSPVLSQVPNCKQETPP